MARRLARPTALLAALLLLLGFVVAAPTSSAGPAPSFSVRGSIEQIYVWGTTPGATVELLDDALAVIDTQTSDAQGSVLFKDGEFKIFDDGLRLTAGDTYTVRVGAETSAPVEVLGAPALGEGTDPGQAFYDGQTIEEGYGYLTTRDGTTLSINVALPGPAEDGPYPTVIEYSGYAPSKPGQTSIALLPYLASGYAVVAVNIRGTGCSGGAYWYWEPAEATDGYDVVETIAAQDWSAKVGLVGISFSGISQLYVGSTNPPHLAAMAPMATIADTFRSTLYPGGILNDGFALDWATARVEETAPGATGWVVDQIDGGDTECEANMAMRLQAEPILTEVTPTRFWEERGAGLAPRTFVDRIEAPTLLVTSWQDEQVGGDAATLMGLFDPATKTRFLATNGTHAEGMFPELLPLSMEWMDFYVAEKVPVLSPLVRAFGGAEYGGIFGIAPEEVEWPDDRFTAFGDDYAGALAAFEAEDPLWIFWENGAGRAGMPGYPRATQVETYASYPPPSQQPWPLYLGADGMMGPRAPKLADDEPRGVASWTHDESQGEVRTLGGAGQEGPWANQPGYDWQPMDEDTSLSWVTSPLASKTSFLGSASVDLWLQSSAVDVDLEVTLSEVRPDGQEMMIQHGWLRASQRKLDDVLATVLRPFHTHLEGDEADLPADTWEEVRVEIVPFAHTVRQGSRLRLTVDAPGGTMSRWEFDVEQHPGPVVNEVAMTSMYPSRVVLPRIATAGVPSTLPPCPYSLRSQPCRDWVPSRAPTGVYGDPAGDGSIDVRWTPPATTDPVIGYGVFAVEVGGAETSIGAVPPGTTSIVFTPADPAVEYAFYVTALYGSGDESSSPSHLVSADGVGPFDDVPVGHAFFDDVMYLRANGITNGFPDNTYHPLETISRQALVAFLHRLAGEPAGPFPDPGFSDVTAESPFYDEISWAAANGIVNGYADGTFRPGNPISRQAIAALLYRLEGSPAGPFDDPGFPDVPGDHLFADAIWWAAQNGIVTGYGDSTFRPTTSASRQAMAAFLCRYALLTVV